MVEIFQGLGSDDQHKNSVAGEKRKCMSVCPCQVTSDDHSGPEKSKKKNDGSNPKQKEPPAPVFMH